MKIITKHITPDQPNVFRIDRAIKSLTGVDRKGKSLVYTTAKMSDPDKNGVSMLTVSQQKIDDSAVDALKASLQKQMTSGCDCPVCGQFVKLYSRTINSTMAKALLIFYKKLEKYGIEYMHLFDAFSDEKDPTVYRGDFAKLRFWGLVKEAPSAKATGKKTSGKWCLTTKGRDFVEGQISVPKYVYVYNNTVQSLSPEEIKIMDALKNPFDYDEIMGTKKTSILNTLVNDNISFVHRDGTHAF